MLGELYKPKGLARETAQAVLEVEEPYAVNVALGCPNGCSYCYGPLCMKMSREEWCKLRFPKKPSAELVKEQLERAFLKNPLSSLRGLDGVFMSFFTDCFHPKNRKNTEDLIRMLWHSDFRIHLATSSKLGITHECDLAVRHGISLVSLDERFWKKYEPNALSPKMRLRELCCGHIKGYSWVSMEPYPTSVIWKQDINELLEELAIWGTDLIVFGKWNYDKRANTEEARKEYAENIQVLTDFCKSNDIRLHIKSDTLKFVGGEVKG